MFQQQEPVFTKILQEIQTHARPFSLFKDIPSKNLESLSQYFSKINLLEMEQQLNCKFSSWLIEKLHHQPEELIKIFALLDFIKHPLQSNFNEKQPLIHQLCQYDNAIYLLRLLFSNINRTQYQISHHQPPYTNPLLSAELFLLLIEKYQRYGTSENPVFWALKNENIDVFERILTIKPEWVDVQDQLGFTPIMFAIKEQKIFYIQSLIKFHPNIQLVNYQQESIAHILLQTNAPTWIHTLTETSEYQALQLSSMLSNSLLKDKNDRIPLEHALYHPNLLPWLQTQLTKHPELRSFCMNNYAQAVRLNRVDILDILNQDLQLALSEPLLFDLLLDALDFHHESIIEWLLKQQEISSHFYKAATYLGHLKNMQWQLINKHILRDGLDWEKIPAQVCFWITSTLIKSKQSHLIIEYGLFDLSPHFHTLICPHSYQKTTFINISLSSLEYALNPIFITFFLNFLEENKTQYPNWLADFYEDTIQLIQQWSIPKNALVHGSSLIHFIAQEDERLNTENIFKFINAEVYINRHDKHHQHLFFKLMQNPTKGFELIKKLKTQFPQFSLEHLDELDSNLLHIAIDLKHIPCVRWCMTQNLSPLSKRIDNPTTALEYAFQPDTLEIYDILKKQIKKSEILEFFEELINKNNISLLQDLLTESSGFSWKFSSSDLKELKKLKHPLIQEFLQPAPIIKNKPVVSTEPKAPKLLNVDRESFLQMIIAQKTNDFENLTKTEYQPVLRELFSNEFLYYIQQVFESPCKQLNKIFIRIPAAQEKINQLNAWDHLFSLALRNQNINLIHNLLGRNLVIEQLKAASIKYYQLALTYLPELWMETLSTTFPLTAEEQITLIHTLIEHHQPDLLNLLLNRKIFQQAFLNAASETYSKLMVRLQEPVWMHFVSTNAFIQMHIIQHSELLFIALFKHQLTEPLKEYLKNPDFRNHLRAHIQTILNLAISENKLQLLNALWQPYSELANHLRSYIPVLQVTLPDLIIKALDLGYSNQQIIWLVGSTIHYILEQRSLLELNDIDLASPTPPASSVFQQSSIISQLFYTQIEMEFSLPMKVQYFVSPKDPIHFIAQDFISRDFTANAIYANRDGHVYDPTGMGLSDFKQRLIRTISPPDECFNEDPVRILRAFKLMSKGFTLLPEVEKALREWTPKEEKANQGRVYAMTCQLLNSRYGFQYLEWLRQYNLIHTLLQYDGHLTLDHLCHFTYTQAQQSKSHRNTCLGP